MALKSFGTYNFMATHIEQQSLNNNFGDVIIRTTRFPGMEGGYSDQGTEPSPNEIGIVWFSFKMESSTRAGMQTLRNDVMKMKKAGMQKLTQQWLNGTETWCYAFINHIEMKEDLSGNSDLWQPVEIIFTVPYPFWLNSGNALLWDDTLDWDTGEDWGPSTDVINASGLLTSDTITVGGLYPVPAIVIVEVPAAKQAHNLLIERANAELTLFDWFKYTGTLDSGDNLVVDSRVPEVVLNGADGYTTAFTYLYPRWLLLDVGANTINVRMNLTTDEAKVWIVFQEEF